MYIIIFECWMNEAIISVGIQYRTESGHLLCVELELNLFLIWKKYYVIITFHLESEDTKSFVDSFSSNNIVVILLLIQLEIMQWKRYAEWMN